MRFASTNEFTSARFIERAPGGRVVTRHPGFDGEMVTTPAPCGRCRPQELKRNSFSPITAQAEKEAAPAPNAISRSVQVSGASLVLAIRVSPAARFIPPHARLAHRPEVRPANGVSSRRPDAAVARWGRLFAHKTPATQAPIVRRCIRASLALSHRRETSVLQQWRSRSSQVDEFQRHLTAQFSMAHREL